MTAVASGQRLRVLIADDDPLVRRALRRRLEELRIEIVAEADDGDSAVSAALDEHPDVVLMDIDMPRVDGITATLRLHRRAPDIPIVMFSASDDPDLGILGLRAGASGFITKDVSAIALARALYGVARGEAALSRTLTLGLVERLRRLPGQGGGLRPVKSDLTTREWQVLDLMCEGASTAGIAAELVLTVETVRSHIKHILAKLGVHSREEAVAAANKLRELDLGGAGEERDEEADELAFRHTLERLRRRGKGRP